MAAHFKHVTASGKTYGNGAEFNSLVRKALATGKTGFRLVSKATGDVIDVTVKAGEPCRILWDERDQWGDPCKRLSSPPSGVLKWWAVEGL